MLKIGPSLIHGLVCFFRKISGNLLQFAIEHCHLLVDLPIKYDDFYSKLLVCQKVIYISIYGITTNQFLTALLLRKPLISVACFPFPGKNEFHDGFPTLTYLDPETEQKWQ
jgi:hypothetical protein